MGGRCGFCGQGGGCLEEPLPVPGQEPWAAGSTESPCPSPSARPGVPSPPAPLLGLPDEAFESLTQLQHIYVAHNKVRYHPNPTPDQTWPGQHHTAPNAEGTAQGWKGATRTSTLCSHSSQWPPSFCPVPCESQIWLRTK